MGESIPRPQLIWLNETTLPSKKQSSKIATAVLAKDGNNLDKTKSHEITTTTTTTVPTIGHEVDPYSKDADDDDNDDD